VRLWRCAKECVCGCGGALGSVWRCRGGAEGGVRAAPGGLLCVQLLLLPSQAEHIARGWCVMNPLPPLRWPEGGESPWGHQQQRVERLRGAHRERMGLLSPPPGLVGPGRVGVCDPAQCTHVLCKCV
jgi:hypothetical protein